MPLRRLVLLFAAACVPAPDPAPTGASPVPKDSPAGSLAGPPVSKDSPAAGQPPASASPASAGAVSKPVPGDRPTEPAPVAGPRLVHDHLEHFAALVDGGLLVAPRTAWVDASGAAQTGPGGLHRLAPGDGALTPWSQGWRPAEAGWKLAEPDADHGTSPQVSPDGRWVALQHVFTPTSAPRPGKEDVIAIVVSRADGSEPRCVGVAALEDEGEAPPLAWTADSARLIGGWSGQCEPDARGRIRDFSSGKKFGAWPRPMRWFAPQDGSSGETPGVWAHDLRDPLGDVVAARYHEGEADGIALHHLDTGVRLVAVADVAGSIDFASGWLAADALLTDVYSEPARKLLGHRIVRTDGRAVAAPGPGWRIYTRLADGGLLFTRDAGESVEQGRIEPADFTVSTSRPRPDLTRFAGPFTPSSGLFGKVTRPPTWTPALGGVLIHEPDGGALWLAAI